MSLRRLSVLALVGALAPGCSEADGPPPEAPARVAAGARPAAERAGELAPLVPQGPAGPPRTPSIGETSAVPTDGRREAVDRVVPEGHTAVIVVDHVGGPVEGLEVVGVEVDGDGRITERPRFVFGAETGPDGRAFVREFRTGERHATRIFGGLVVISAADDPDRIQLPATGSLALDLRGFPDARTVRVSVADGSEFEGGAGGQAFHYARVPIGIELEVVARGEDRMHAARISGPTEAGQTVTWRAAPPRFLDVTARIVDGAGAPLAGTSAHVRWSTTEGLVLDAEESEPGLVRATITADRWSPDGESQGIVVEHVEDRMDAGLRVARITPPALPEGGGIDLGVVALERLPIIAQGRVVDGAGDPVAGARVRLRRQIEREAIRTGFHFEGHAGAADGSTEVADRDPIAEILDEGRVGAPSAAVDVTDSAGHFELRATSTPDEEDLGPLFVLARHPKLVDLTARQRFTPGRTDMVLTLRTPGSIRVDPVHVHPALRQHLGFVAARDDEWLPGSSWSARAAQWLDGGPASMSVPPGVYGVGITMGGAVVASLDDAIVPSGAASSDVRLLPLVLDERSVELVGEGGEIVRSARILYFSSTSDATVRLPVSADPETGRICFVQPKGDGGVILVADGHAPRSLSGVADGARVELVPLIRVRLVLRGSSHGPGWGHIALERRQPGWPDDSNRVIAELDRDGSDWVADVSLAPGARYTLTSGLPSAFDVERSAPHPWYGQSFRVPDDAKEVVLRPR